MKNPKKKNEKPVTTLTININNNDDTLKRISHCDIHRYMNQSEQKALAFELAEALNDTGALTVYFAFVEKYPETLLREVLAITLAVPSHKIRKTRGALFTYLLQQKDHANRYYPRH
jgi:hypothetical protein